MFAERHGLYLYGTKYEQLEAKGHKNRSKNGQNELTPASESRLGVQPSRRRRIEQVAKNTNVISSIALCHLIANS